MNLIKTTIYVDTYACLRAELVNHLEKQEYNDEKRRKILAQKFYEAKKNTYSIEEKDLHEFLTGCGDPIYETSYYTGDEYLEFIINAIKTFNHVLPDSVEIPKIK